MMDEFRRQIVFFVVLGILAALLAFVIGGCASKPTHVERNLYRMVPN